MRRYANIQIVVHPPASADGKQTLAQKTAQIHADAVATYLQSSSLSAEEIQRIHHRLMDDTIRSIRR